MPIAITILFALVIVAILSWKLGFEIPRDFQCSVSPGVNQLFLRGPEENASTSVLKKLRFRLVGAVQHPEDGLVWEWQLSDTSQA